MQRPINDVIERLKSADPLVREAAIRELAASKDPGAVAALNYVSQNDPDLKLRALAGQIAQAIQAKGGGNGGQPAQRPPAQQSPSGEKVYQMLWDCRFCGATKLLGIEHRHCPNCGAAQDPEWRYFPSDADLKVVNDPKYQYAGVDKKCPFCGQPNSAAAKFCKDCGGDLSGAQAVATKGTLSAGLEGARGVRDDVVKQKFEAEQAAIKAKAGRRGPSKVQIALLAVVVLCLAAFGAYMALSRSTYGSSLSVANSNWQRVITVERLTAQPGSGWSDQVPGDAYNKSCHAQDRCHNESESYVCGSVNVDRGDGSFTKQDKYCTRNKQVCVPASMCSYTVNRWISAPDVMASGGPSDPLTWPVFAPQQTSGVGAQRESGRKEILTVVFKDPNGTTYAYNPKDYATWQSFKVGQAYTVNINRLNQVQWDTLKLTSAQ